MTKPERQERDRKIAIVAFQYLKMEMGLVKVLWNMEGMYGLSKSQIRKIVKKAQDNCNHEFHRPYELSTSYIVCRICWVEMR